MLQYLLLLGKWHESAIYNQALYKTPVQYQSDTLVFFDLIK